MQIKERLSRDFRIRVRSAMKTSATSQAQLARQIGIERSALSQLLRHDEVRLPRTESLVSMAEVLNVSCDWLLGRDASRESQAQILEEAMQFEPDDNVEPDRQLQQWHLESRGEKIRYLPSTLPDLLKTHDIIEYEEGTQSERFRRNKLNMLADLHRKSTLLVEDIDMEVCLPYQRLVSLARGEDIWSQLPKKKRIEQLRHIQTESEIMYPNLRIYLVDGLSRIAAPYTIFGRRRVAIYLGQAFFVFTTSQHIREINLHFNGLIKNAVTQPPDLPTFIEQILLE